MLGISARHGPHQVAHLLRKTTRPRCSLNVIGLPSRSRRCQSSPCRRVVIGSDSCNAEAVPGGNVSPIFPFIIDRYPTEMATIPPIVRTIPTNTPAKKYRLRNFMIRYNAPGYLGSRAPFARRWA